MYTSIQSLSWIRLCCYQTDVHLVDSTVVKWRPLWQVFRDKRIISVIENENRGHCRKEKQIVILLFVDVLQICRGNS